MLLVTFQDVVPAVAAHIFVRTPGQHVAILAQLCDCSGHVLRRAAEAVQADDRFLRMFVDGESVEHIHTCTHASDERCSYACEPGGSNPLLCTGRDLNPRCQLGKLES